MGQNERIAWARGGLHFPCSHATGYWPTRDEYGHIQDAFDSIDRVERLVSAYGESDFFSWMCDVFLGDQYLDNYHTAFTPELASEALLAYEVSRFDRWLASDEAKLSKEEVSAKYSRR